MINIPSQKDATTCSTQIPKNVFKSKIVFKETFRQEFTGRKEQAQAVSRASHGGCSVCIGSANTETRQSASVALAFTLR